MVNTRREQRHPMAARTGRRSAQRPYSAIAFIIHRTKKNNKIYLVFGKNRRYVLGYRPFSTTTAQFT